jgi:hypothetical protein
MWYRAGAVMGLGTDVTVLPRIVARVAAAGVVACALGCGEGASKPAPAPEPPAASQPEDTRASDDLPESDAAFRLSIDGWVEELGAKAQLNVTEGKPVVRLEITGTGLVDVLLLDVNFDGVEGTMGLHQVELGLPVDDDPVDSAVASLDGQPYHSQSGHVEVTLSPDGSIHGTFDVALALDPDFAPDEPVKFELTDQLRPLSGSFSGHWDLYCQSHLPGHGDAFMKGGHYCEGIAFE